MDKLRIACGNRGVGTAPLFATVEGGYFQEQGLEPELRFYQGHPKALPALVAGEADFANSVSPDVITIDVRTGADVVIVASAVSRSATYVCARPGLSRREDLRGQRWGVLARGDADHCALVMAFERWGWDPTKDAVIVAVGPEGSRLDLLLDPARVDVAILHSPEPFQAARRGWHLVEDLRRLDVAFQNSCAATTRRFAAARPDVVDRYVRAYCRGVYRFRADGTFGIQVIRKYSGETDHEILEAAYLYFSQLMGGTMYPTPEGVATAARLLHRLGVIPGQPAPEAFIDQEPIARLHREGFFRGLVGLMSV
jgi:ABC-type nitrate/sulfonate/bicarbonate transport system substrate-binding protein